MASRFRRPHEERQAPPPPDHIQGALCVALFDSNGDGNQEDDSTMISRLALAAYSLRTHVLEPTTSSMFTGGVDVVLSTWARSPAQRALLVAILSPVAVEHMSSSVLGELEHRCRSNVAGRRAPKQCARTWATLLSLRRAVALKSQAEATRERQTSDGSDTRQANVAVEADARAGAGQESIRSAGGGYAAVLVARLDIVWRVDLPIGRWLQGTASPTLYLPQVHFAPRATCYANLSHHSHHILNTLMSLAPLALTILHVQYVGPPTVQRPPPPDTG